MRLSIISQHKDGIVNELESINKNSHLSLDFELVLLDKLSDKALLQQLKTQNTPSIAIIKNTPMLTTTDGQMLIKSALNWQSLTHRIVSAGRKSELLLQACKIHGDMQVLDGTAGFGHDGLILASTGACVLMCETNPVMALLLMYEHQLMMANKNWQGLLSRVQIIHQNATCASGAYDCVYLDPMFPQNSYKAKVGKQMQLLHTLAVAPSPAEENELFDHANALLKQTARLVIKRPATAVYFANQTPSHSVQNDAIRFDCYNKI